MLVIPVLGKLRHENQEFRANLGYVVRADHGQRNQTHVCKDILTFKNFSYCILFFKVLGILF